ncbi:CPBP family intramembrane metalloprotease [Halobaculum sp. CBA1158]|uniref:CPBP family intramembrane glutamic endopeptidase n=1 Tax=Halobaculum sp. CBA1158 TaxID=2904243 RepID=UPI001F349641|nr:CPBP family intramembrane glutamic endopeptidase [Halobaculum sp. CBA1158]UIP00898.1 CPBP family intramembrane metalloprotease [Halobaculum sp. CBA1158]
MTRWTAFAAITGVVLLLLLGLARLSSTRFSPSEPPARVDGDADRGPEDAALASATATTPHGSVSPTADRRLSAPERSPVAAAEAEAELSAGALLANVALSQGTFGAVLVAAAVWAGIPAGALGLDPVATLPDLGVGVALGGGLWVANEVGGRAARRVGVETNEALRGALAPDSTWGWVVLLGGVLPTVALFEEFLFRAVLVGALSAGFDAPAWLPASVVGVAAWPWLLAAASSVAFALGHGAQGRAGIAATGLLGFVLAAAFVSTGSLLAVVVAHYLVNAATLVVHEGPIAGD